jgi:hypothetical protein
MLHVALSLLFSTLAAAAIPDGICPFNASKVQANFGKILVDNLGVDSIAEVFQRREKWYGACKSIKPTRGNFYALAFDGVTYPIELKLQKGKIVEFAFGLPKFQNDSWEKLLGTLSLSFPNSGLYIVNLNTKAPIAAIREREVLDLADGRDLLLVATANRKIREGKLSDEQVLVLQNSDKASDLDDVAEKKPGYRLKLSEAKDRVLGQFDHSASDLLLRALGREAMEEGRPFAVPFLSRRERNWLFTLPPEKMKALKKSNSRETAQALDKPKEIPPLAPLRYDALGKVGWWGNARELCGALTQLSGSPELKNAVGSKGFSEMHPGWKSVGYSSSSVSGVMHSAWLATMPGKDPICFSLVINAPEEVNSEASAELVDRAIALLEK